MASITLNLSFMRGSAFNEQLTIQDVAPDGSETATDLTGAATTWVLWDPETAAIVLTKTHATPTTEIEHTAPTTAGILLLKFITGDTEALTPDRQYTHQMVTTLADGRIKEVIDPASTFVVTTRRLVAVP